MKKLICFLAFTVLVICQSSAQRSFDIRLKLQSTNCETNEFCYDVQIRGGDEMLWRFSGQNYRLFYNGALAEYSRVIPVLEQPYSHPEVVQDIQHLDLSAQGNLPFDADLSWLNYFIDMNVAFEGQIISPDVWTTTSTLCFTSLVDMMEDPDICFEMVWAREELTFNYATAFVEVSEWVAPNSTNDHVSGSTYIDLNSESGNDACFDLVCGDNAPQYNTQITLKSTDPNTNISCYAVEIKSASSRTWNLGDHNISLLFDGSQASFVSASSSLSGSGSLVFGESLENVAFNDGSGNISFENNISATSFSVPEGDGSTVIGNTYTEIAEFCLDLSNEIPGQCFEIVQGQEGVTDEYFEEFSEISQAGSEEASLDEIKNYNKCNAAECPDLAAPTSNGDVTICAEDDIPILTVQGIDGYTTRWFATPVGGTALSQGETYAPGGPGIFYAETFDEGGNCYSATRTAVALIEVPLPSMTVISKACINDQSSYTLRFTTDANSVEASTGTLEKLVGLEWMVSGVLSGEEVTVTLTNNLTSCSSIILVDAPNCECQLVSSPISNGDMIACLSNSYAPLSVNVIQQNMTADWYTRVDGGTPIATDQLEYIPSNIGETGVYTYYVQARSLENGCESPMRTAINFTVLDPPVYAFVEARCEDDLSTYSAAFYSDATMVSSDLGVVENDGNGIWRLSGVETGADATLSITSPAGCAISRTITSPQCECDLVEAPVCEGEISICEGMDYNGFKAFAYHNNLIRWYDAPSGGTLLAEGETFKPSMSGTYYAEAIDNVTGCTSQQRTQVTLTINVMPSIQIGNTVFCEGETITWADLIDDETNAEGTVGVFSDFRDAMNNVNALTSPTLLISDISSYFIRKTTAAGCYDIETIIIVPDNCGEVCVASAGEFAVQNAPCFGGEPVTISVQEVAAPGLPTGYEHGFVVTSGDDRQVLEIIANGEYTVSAPGTYRLHSLVVLPFDPRLDEVIGGDGISIEGLSAVLTSGGGDVCGALDAEGVLFEIEVCQDMCQANSGTTTPQSVSCLDDANSIELQVETDPLEVVIPAGFTQIFIWTRGSDRVIIGAGNDPFFAVEPGEYRVHSFVFDPSTLDFSTIQIGTTTASDLYGSIMEGGGSICASLDLDGALFNISNCTTGCDANSGITTPSNAPCFDPNTSIATLEASTTGTVIPSGYEQAYIFTSGTELAFLGSQEESTFFVRNTGDYRVHSFVYDPSDFDLTEMSTTFSSAFDIYAMTTAGGGNLCASLDINGASFNIENCTEACLAFSGDTNPLEIECITETNGATLAVLNTNATIPTGYSQMYVLTTGAELVIIGAQVDPFVVDAPGQYQVHSLVFDPTTLDLSSVVPGVTTATTILAMLEQGGGNICGSLEVEGAVFQVEECDDEECEAAAGVTVAQEISCLDGSPITLQIANSGSVIPAGYSQIYVLTKGNDQTIQAAQSNAFEVNAEGVYQVHSLVFDPTTLDLSIVVPGVTSATVIMGMLEQGGGDICGSLEVEGAIFEVEECDDEECEAVAGETVAQEISCLDGSPVTLQIANSGSVIPAGYSQIFVLTEGNDLTIQAAQSNAFEVNAEGVYQVHSLVFDPSTLDLSIVVPGVTSATMIMGMLEQGGGDICGSLEVEGAIFEVEECDEEECLADAGSTEPEDIGCLEAGSTVALEVALTDDAVVPEGYVRSTIITQGNDFIIVGIQPEAYLASEMGDYEVNSFVYDPTTFDPSSVVLGTTDFFDLYAMFIEDGGELCGSIDFFGASFSVEACESDMIDLEITKDINNLNPVTGEEVTFTIEVFNRSNSEATGVSVIDVLPAGYSLSGNISNGGTSVVNGANTDITWTNLSIDPSDVILLSFMAKLNEVDDINEYRNTAQVIASDQDDVDSTPNNDDGDQSEDDEDNLMPNVAVARIDLELVKTANVSTVEAGDAVRFNLNLSNRAMTPASGIQVTDELPEGFDLSSIVNISNGGILNGTRIVWSDLEMGLLSSMNLSYIVSVRDDFSGDNLMNTAQITDADQDDVDSTPNNDDGDQSEDDESKVTITVAAPFIDLSLDKAVNNLTPLQGETVSFEITVNNNGLVPATGVSVADMLPMTGYDVSSISNVNPLGQIVGNTIIWTIDEIAPNGEATVSFDVDVLPGGSDYKNIAQVTSANEQDIDSSPNNDDGDQSEDDEDSVTVIPITDGEDLTDIEVQKTVSNLTPCIGDEVIYTIEISNNGPSLATNLVLRDVTPDGIDAVDVTGDHTQGDGVITWSIEALAVGETMTFTYNSMVFESALNDYTNVVELIDVDQDDIDSSPNNDDGDQSEDDEDSATIFPVTKQNIDLELTKSVDKACASASERIEFSIEIFNNSTVTATDVAVQDVFSDGFTMIEDISNGGSLMGSTINWSGLSLLPSETMTLTYTAMMSGSGTTFRNTAQITAAGQIDEDSTPNNDDGDQSEDDEDSVIMGGGAGFDLELEKIVDNEFARPGERVRFDIIVRNVGCADATGVAIRDIIPGGYKAINHITDGGERNANIITWEDLDVEAGFSESVSFTAEVVHFSINCDYMNVAEIIASDQDDMDSTPNNDDGDQSEDDEDSASVLAGSVADLELAMATDISEVETGDMVTYTVELCNNGPANAFNVQIRNYLPEGLQVVGDINYKGELVGNEITWSGFTVVSGECAELVFQAQVMEAAATVEMMNEAEIMVSNQLDPDSSPGNGDASEDDHAMAMITHFVGATGAVLNDLPNMMEVDINTALFLEGAYNKTTGQLKTTLNDLGYLPGQKPVSFFAEMTTPGQPYTSGPWNYKGEEGMIFNTAADFSITYPKEAVDWVLVSVREGKDASSTVLTRAGLLMKDGSVTFPQDSEPVYLDANKSYYILVQHRNHLPILSPSPMKIEEGKISFDFRYNESYVGLLGSGQKDVNGVYCVFAANGDQFRNAISQYDINVVDMDAWFQSNGSNSSYMIADFDMNGDVNVNDQIMWLLNNGVFSDIPR